MKVLVTCLALASISCAHLKEPLVVTGESLVLMADQFTFAAATMDRALNTGAITNEQYEQWAKFGVKFQRAYPLAVSLWDIARVSNDKELQNQVVQMVTNLAIELATFIEGVK